MNSLRNASDTCARWGLGGLRPLQAEVLKHLARGQNVFGSLPTGYGKSLCYWIPAVAWNWRVWVVSPLVSLIEDQTLAARAKGIPVIGLRGKISSEDSSRLESGAWSLCLLSPERLVMWKKSGYLEGLKSAGLGADLLVVDEMHCLQEWRSFRSGYDDLVGVLRSESQNSIVLGLSASLSERDARAWMHTITDSFEIVRGNLGRENLVLTVVGLETERERWLHLAAALRDLRAPNSALVYCQSREETEKVAHWLTSLGIAAVPFHAGLPPSWKSIRSQAFRAGHLRVVCATVAFGMGIDYPNVSRVIHFSLPRDLESYWQEVGRAGRGGDESHAIAFWRRSEIARARKFSGKEREKFFSLWRAWASEKCRKAVVAECLGMTQIRCGKCDNCSKMRVHPLLGPIEHNAWWLQDKKLLREWLQKREALHSN